MATLTDELLLDSFKRATELKLDRDFLALLLAEIRKRNLNSQLHRQLQAIFH
ncbi:developmental checkpoint coupling sporulation initiation to replication initiation [Paenibacillus shirakamiensis]|uniref:Developmental checkpoint coupling sporulation initiation to replication initiation n=1 Tax=Paenibacillus shirakamiensis TaxID=1265935 RepID=A0ABS4JK58_9BACL|nr:sporulation histidine kinase inhibitor Sda [Paenibacillus shirakamiensis]MBP2002082.1 developmental checkpoint coupling sporulation initiation to replication initiation [Paenibacillus shirakamiensis]